MLGRCQREWLEKELAVAGESHALVVWVNVVPWITKNARGSDHGWEPYSYERTLIANKIKSLGLVDKIVMLSGDAHMVAIDDGTYSNYASDAQPTERAFPVIHAAPLDRYPRKKGGPYSHGYHAKRRFFGLLKSQQFGLMNVRDDGRNLEVEFSGHNANGARLAGMLLKMRCDENGCRIVD
jgi:alkaline phosphatase D